MSGLFDRAIATATRLIAKDGDPCTWVSAAAPSVADPDQPWIMTDNAPVTYQVPIVFVNESSNPFAKLVTGSQIPGSGKRGLMATVPFTPQLTDTVIRSDGTKMALLSIDPLDPNGAKILWKLVFKA